MISSCLDDATPGDRHVRPGRTITETDPVLFAMFSGGWQPIHADAEYAAADSADGARIASGALMLSAALGLVRLWPPGWKALYGVDRQRFTAPARIGDTVHGETEVIAVDPRDDGSGVVTSRSLVVSRHGEPVLLAAPKALVTAAESGRSG